MKKCIIIGVVFILVTIGVFAGCVYRPEKGNILKHLELNEGYAVVSVESDFVSGNECFWFVSITIQNKTTNELIILDDFNYDDCEDKLYYGWYKGNKLDAKYGVIIDLP